MMIRMMMMTGLDASLYIGFDAVIIFSSQLKSEYYSNIFKYIEDYDDNS